MKKRFMAISLMVFLLVACDFVPYGAPEMVDRTVGWAPSVIDYEILQIRRLSENDPVFYSFLFADSQISKDTPIFVDQSKDAASILEYALKEAFQDKFIDIGTRKAKRHYEPGWNCVLYVGGGTCVIVEPETGRIIQCIDKRIQTAFQVTDDDDFREGFARVSLDLALLSKDELRIYTSFARNIADATLPDSFFVEGTTNVYEVYEATKSILYQRYSYGVLSSMGKEWKIYNAKKSNCWLIVSNKIILMLDKDTGERLLFVTFLNGSCRDLSVECRTQGEDGKVSRGRFS